MHILEKKQDLKSIILENQWEESNANLKQAEERTKIRAETNDIGNPKTIDKINNIKI